MLKLWVRRLAMRAARFVVDGPLRVWIQVAASSILAALDGIFWHVVGRQPQSAAGLEVAERWISLFVALVFVFMCFVGLLELLRAFVKASLGGQQAPHTSRRLLRMAEFCQRGTEKKVYCWWSGWVGME